MSLLSVGWSVCQMVGLMVCEKKSGKLSAGLIFSEAYCAYALVILFVLYNRNSLRKEGELH